MILGITNAVSLEQQWHKPYIINLLINTGLMSIGPLIKKLLQKHRPVAKNKENMHFPHGPLLKAQ